MSPKEIEILVTALMRYESIAKNAMSWLTAEHLDAQYPSPLAGLLWDTVLSTLEKEKINKVPKTAEFAKQLFEAIVSDRFDEETAAGLITTGRGVIDAIFAEPEDATKQASAREMLSELHKEFVMQPEMARAFAAASASGDYAELSKVQAKLSAATMSISEESVYADPLSMLDTLDQPIDGELDADPAAGSRLLTGTVVDALHGGRGPYRGLMTLVLGPTSGGKTTLTHNIIAESCMLGHSVGLVSTEEDLESSPMAKSRLLAAASGIETTLWDAAGNDARRLSVPLTPAQLDRMKRMRANTKFYNFKTTPTFKDLTDRVEASAEERGGRQHDILLIDWAGPLAKVISQSRKNPSDHECLEHIAFECQEFAKKTGIAVFLLHQLTAETVKRSGIFGRYTEFDSQNCRKMSSYSGATYVLSPYDKQMRLRLIGVKMRADVKNYEIVAQLDPTRSRVTYMESMTVQGASFRDSKAPTSVEAGRKIPSARKAD